MAVAYCLRHPSTVNKRVAPLEERNPEAEASVKGATRPSSYREHRPANGEGSSAFRQDSAIQAIPAWLELGKEFGHISQEFINILPTLIEEIVHASFKVLTKRVR